jgi:phosphonoacetaldehyde hydrolase
MRQIKLVVFDWAGTTVDFGCCAPVTAFVQAFADAGVSLTATEARGPMGLHKKDHIRALLQQPPIARRWQQAHRQDWTQGDVEDLYRRFIPLQLETIDRESRLIAGLLPCVSFLRGRNIRIGATTGYFREAAQRVCEAARLQGFTPDHSVGADDVPSGRPLPWMVFRNMEALGIYPPAAVIKVGDTVPDIEEGRNAGVWAIGVVRTSNEVGLGESEFEALPAAEQRARLQAARIKLLDAGAHQVLDSVADLPDLIPEIERRLGLGEKP